MLRRRWSTVVVLVVGALALGAPQVASADISSPTGTSFDANAGAPFSGRVASFSSSFGDIDNFGAEIDWGDGGPSSEGSITSCPDCPNYGYYIDGSHTYQSAGSYATTITIRSLRDGDSARALGTANVTTATQPPQPGLVPPQLGRVPVDFTRVRLHGPASLSARGLTRLLRTPLSRRGGELEQAPASEEFEATEPVRLLDCAGLCGPAIGVGLPAVSPAATKPFSCCMNGQPDPQIAASNSYLVIGNRDTVWFYDKAGKQLYTKAAGPSSEQSVHGAISNKSYPYTVPLCKLFKPLIPQMNAALDATLPHQLDDPDGNAINVQNGYGLNCDTATGGVRPDNWSLPPVPNDDSTDGFYHPFSTIYDARVLWDEYHKRFWITALAYNTVTQRRVVHATWKSFQNQGTYNVAHSRRAMLAVAVSKSGDPREGWELFWTWTTPDQTTCPANDCGLYGAADFLRAGISSRYLVLNSKVNDFNEEDGTYSDKYGDLPDLPKGEERGQIVVLPTEPVVSSSKEVVPVYSNAGPLLAPDGTSTESIWPTVQHAPDFDSGRELFLASLYTPQTTPVSYSVLLWMLPFDAAGAPQGMYQLPVEVNPFGGFPGCKNPPVQQPSGDNTCIFGGGIPNYVAYRNGSLYTTFAECGSMSSGTCLYSALRFVRIQINGIVKGFGAPVTLHVEKAVDRSFVGPPNPAWPGNHAWYGFPGVDANKNGDAVIAYERSGSFVSPEARYSAYYKDEADVRASKLLMAGDSSFGVGSGPHHYMGMSVDPFDKIGIWMIEGFAKNGGRSWAIGKALGQAHSDLQAAVLGGGVLKLVKGGPGAALYTLKLPLRNGGDGRAAKSVGRVHLVTGRGRASASRRGAPIRVKRFGVRRLAPGQSTNLKLRIRVPARARGHRYLRVALDTKKRLKEYGEQNNAIYVRLPKRRGR